MRETAWARWSERGVDSIVVRRPGTPAATVELLEQGARAPQHGTGERLLFDGIAGAPRTPPEARAPSAAQAAFWAMRAST